MDLSNYNLTPSAKKAIDNSRLIAKKLGHLKVIDLHLLSSLLEFEHSNIDYVFISNGLIKEGINKNVNHVLLNYKEPRRKKEIFAPEITEILDNALIQSRKFKDNYIGIDHILFSILTTREEIADFFVALEVDLKNFLKDFKEIIRSGPPQEVMHSSMPDQSPSNKTPSLDISDWSENLNEKILKRGNYEICGREKEIERTFEILLKRNKSNVILVGEAGVGKTAIAEGLAEKIVKRECPDLLLHKEVISLDLTSILAGTIYRGQMEQKLKDILSHLSERKQYILFIDEIHTIVGAGSGTEGGLDFANIFKPALSRGNISCIGATTMEEYNSFFKKDSALDRRFEKIEILEPTKEETLNLIKVAKEPYETYHQVKYSEEVLEKIIDLCDIYLKNKKFPDKAFDILDESGARTKKTNISRPKKAKDMEGKLTEENFKSEDEYGKYFEKYSKILLKWGKSLENKVFDVDIETIYDIFAFKLKISKEDIKHERNAPSFGKIGF
jgi:ATP-dependent Clp protease ATP-binding subunit ClpC